MARYTETEQISFGTRRKSRIINVSSGTLTINMFDGDSFVPTNTVIYAGDSQDVITRGLALQFNITAGGSYYIEEGDK